MIRRPILFRTARLVPLLLASFFVIASAATAHAQNRNTITGFVFDTNRRPVSNIYVELTNELYQVLQRVRTDGSGRYFFGGLSSGRFYVKVLPYGTNFEEQTQEVEIVNIPRPSGATSDQAYRDIYLRERRSGPDIRQVSGTVFAQEVPAQAKKLYEKGIAELESNRTEAGINLLLESLKVFPDYFAALERLGREYVRQANYEYARAVYLKVVSVNDRSFAGWYGLGFAAYALKQANVAVEAANKATSLEQGSVEAHLLLGISQRLAKNFLEAEKALLKAKELSKGHTADVHWNLALLYANNMNKYKEAADELELYLKVAPADAKVEDVKKLIAKFREKAASKV